MASYQFFPTARPTTPDPQALIAAIRTAAGDPTAGIGFGRGDGYRVKTAQALTPAQVTAVQAAIDTTPERDEAVIDVDQKVLKALALGLWECIPNPTLTKVQLRARVIAIWKTL